MEKDVTLEEALNKKTRKTVKELFYKEIIPFAQGLC